MEEAMAAPLMPIRGTSKKSSAVVRNKVTTAKLALYWGQPRPSKSALIIFPTANATVPGRIHQITGTLGRNLAPNTTGTSKVLSTARTTAVTHERSKTCRQTRQVNSGLPFSTLRAVRDRVAAAAALGTCQITSESKTPSE